MSPNPNSSDAPKKKILILHTGGTLGMELTGKPSDASKFADNIRRFAPQVFEVADVQVEILFNKDSSNFLPTDWSAIATTLDARMDDWDAFLITHGTDTMAFTASALSFMLKSPPKPIFLTGSQRPLLDARSDAPRNLIYAVELAAQGRFKEVCLFFDALLMRGNRAKKTSIPTFHAFESPNFPPLAKAGVSTEFTPHQPLEGSYRFDPRISANVDNISFFPGMQLPPVSYFVDKGTNAVVLQGFGPGDLPSKPGGPEMSFLAELKEAKVPAILCSQAIYGRVDPDLYEAGRRALEWGVIPAGDMTWESAMTKAMILAGRKIAYEDFANEFKRSFAGEISNEKDAHRE